MANVKVLKLVAKELAAIKKELSSTDPEVAHKEHLSPILAKIGFTAFKRVTAGGRLTRLNWKMPDAGVFRDPNIDLFHNDIYPNQKDECFLYCWSQAGSISNGDTNAVLAALKRAGMTARITKYKGNSVVAFIPNYL